MSEAIVQANCTIKINVLKVIGYYAQATLAAITLIKVKKWVQKYPLLIDYSLTKTSPT